MNKDPFRIAVEGMPGAGKTSSLVRLAQDLGDQYIVLPEINFNVSSVYHNSNLKDQWRSYHHLWYSRLNIVSKYYNNRHAFLMDRSYFSNLAFTFAMDRILGTDEYSKQYEAITINFSEKEFDLLILLNILPEQGMRRKITNKDILKWPYRSSDFLNHMYKFYKEELKSFNLSNLIEIEVSALSQLDLLKIIKSKILEKAPLDKKEINSNKIVNKKQMSTLLSFGKKHGLGSPCADPFFVLGYITLYFRYYCIQLDNDIPKFFDNRRLAHIGKLLSFI